MNAKQMLLDYAAKKNDGKVCNNEQFLGKAMTEGVRTADAPDGSIVVARMRREGKTIVVTETTRTETIEGAKETTVEVLRVSL